MTIDTRFLWILAGMALVAFLCGYFMTLIPAAMDYETMRHGAMK